MIKEKVIPCVLVVLLVCIVILFNNRDRFRETGRAERAYTEETGAVPGKVVQTGEGWELTAGTYYFDSEETEGDLPGGVYDITAREGAAEVDGKKLNEGCTLRYYISREMPLVVSGEGTVLLADYTPVKIKYNKAKDRAEVAESGYYEPSFFFFNESSRQEGLEGVRIYSRDVPADAYPMTVELQDMASGEALVRITLSDAESSAVLRLDEVMKEGEGGKNLYIDLGNETAGWKGRLIMEEVKE